jgi:ferredoxin--NADP+ reductase
MTPDPLNATLVERQDLNESLSIVRVRPDRGRVPEFTPGQFITLGLPRPPGELVLPPTSPAGTKLVRPTKPGRVPLIKRAYSIASAPADTWAYELFVVLVAEGKLTPTLWTLTHGGRVWMDDQAKGEFTLARVPPGSDLVMISTGTGVAPFLAMLRAYRGQGRWRRFVLVNGARRASDLGYRDELAEAARADATVRYIPILSREPDPAAWHGLRGHVQAVLDQRVYRELTGGRLDPQECHVFLCGNPAMIDDVERLLLGRGFRTHTHAEPGNIHFERYW